MKKTCSLILLLIFCMGYIGNGDDKLYSNASVLNYDIEETMFKPVETIKVSIYENIITDDFTDCIRLAVNNAFCAAKILFLNIIDTFIEKISEIDVKSERDSNKKSNYTEV